MRFVLCSLTGAFQFSGVYVPRPPSLAFIPTKLKYVNTNDLYTSVAPVYSDRCLYHWCALGSPGFLSMKAVQPLTGGKMSEAGIALKNKSVQNTR